MPRQPNDGVRPMDTDVLWHVLTPPLASLPSIWKWVGGQWEAGGATLTMGAAYRWGYRYGRSLADATDATVLRDTDLLV